MKKILVFCSFCLVIVGCANGGDTNSSDNAGSGEKPAAIDTTQHATGITNQNVISTDTAAMRIDSFQR